MRRMISPLAAAALLVAAGFAATRAEAAPKWEWNGVSRVVAVGDVHGANYKLVKLLQGASLIDERKRWSGGDAHLVVVGDFVDKLPHDRAVMDLLRRLQEEAPQAGGRVHLLLGNHEVMNLVRDLRYVNRGSYASFADDEKEKERRAAQRLYEKTAADPANFDEDYPPGYFARLRAFDADGEYGRWLIKQPVIVKINGMLFVHGGLTEEVAALGLNGINKRIRDEIETQLANRERLQTRNIVNRLMSFIELQEAAYDYLRRNRRSPDTQSLVAAAANMLDLAESPMFLAEGPVWYRGNSLESERVERERLTRTLELLDADKLVVAHSPNRGRYITVRFSGRLFRVDHGMSSGNDPLALVFEKDQVHVLDPLTGNLSKPIVGLPQGERRPKSPQPLTADELAGVLVAAEVVSSRDLGRGSTRPQLFEMDAGGFKLRGVFKTVERVASTSAGRPADRYQHEVAAYRVSRLLGLDFVPVTVIRENDGNAGSLQEFVEGAVDRVSVESYDMEATDPEKLEQQREQSRIFDQLIGNRDRKATDELYLLDESKLYFIDHSKAFSLAPDVVWPDGMPQALDPDLRESMAGLDVDTLKRELGDLLDARQIKAMLERRDTILSGYAAADTEDVGAADGITAPAARGGD